MSEEEYPMALRVLMAISLILIIVVGLLGNGLICWTLYRNKELRKTLNNWFILNMAFADIGVVIFAVYFPLRTYINGYWDFSSAACQFSGFLNSQLMLASILTLTMISLHQYFTVVSKWPQPRLRRAAVIMLVYIWLHSTILSILPLSGITKYDLKNGRGQCAVKIPETAGEKLTAMGYIVTGFFIPLVIMSFSYYRIMKVVSIHARRVSRMSNSASIDRKAMQKQVVITMIIVLILFLLCWSPFLVMSLLGAFVPALSNPILANLAFLLGFANSCCNPIVLGFRNRAFKMEYMQVYEKFKDVLCAGRMQEKPMSPSVVVVTSSVEASDLSVVYTNTDVANSKVVIM